MFPIHSWVIEFPQLIIDGLKCIETKIKKNLTLRGQLNIYWKKKKKIETDYKFQFAYCKRYNKLFRVYIQSVLSNSRPILLILIINQCEYMNKIIVSFFKYENILSSTYTCGLGMIIIQKMFDFSKIERYIEIKIWIDFFVFYFWMTPSWT